MKTDILRSHERGHANHGWLNSYHSFSFAGYRNPKRMGFGLLRVLNDDTVAPGAGFGTHGHENMEIVSIPLAGTLAHKDSMGSTTLLRPNTIQIMSAGTGLTHSEANASDKDELKFLQIWVRPKALNVQPRYAEKVLDPGDRKNRLQLIVSPDPEADTLWIGQDAFFSVGSIDRGTEAVYSVRHAGNGSWVFVIEGTAEVAGQSLSRRDAIGIWEMDDVTIRASEPAEILVVEVPMNP